MNKLRFLYLLSTRCFKWLPIYLRILTCQVDERNLFLSRENADIISKIEEGEDEIEEVIRKNKHLISEVKLFAIH